MNSNITDINEQDVSSLRTVNQILTGDALTVLKTLPDGIVQTCCTSPPYYGLRDYQTATWEGGNLECVHRVGNQVQDNKAPGAIQAGVRPGVDASRCKLCGATRIDQQIGLEETPEAYVAKLVEVFREVRRVLRDDGTLWLNLGDSYSGSGKGGQSEEKRSENWQPTYANKGTVYPGIKPKDLIGIPWMVAFALRADGWYLRQEIIWHKPNCMPESVEDRPTTAHEHLFLLAKSERYYYDADAIVESVSFLDRRGNQRIAYAGKGNPETRALSGGATWLGQSPEGTRNKRSVWTINTKSYAEAHFATFPPKLIEPCILAGTSPRACEHCGSPWERITETTGGTWEERKTAGVPMRYGLNSSKGTLVNTMGTIQTHTIGWQTTCSCANEGIGKCIVLDPFMGAGTTALVAIQHGRNYLGVELNPAYVQLALKRIQTFQPVLWEVPA